MNESDKILTFKDYLINDPKLDLFEGDFINFNNLPLVSFCIPTFNSSRTIDKCLKSISEQKYPNIEIIIVDNGSSDDTIKIAEIYTDKIYSDDGVLGSVRQTSLEKSQGEIIALFDSDIIIPHNKWLLNSVKFFNYSNNVSTVWPKNIAPPKSPWTTRLYFNIWAMSMNYRIKKGRSVFGGGNALFLRSCLEEVGGINKNIHWGEDFDWAQKLRSKGFQVVAINDPLYHDTMTTLREFAKKQFIASETFTKENVNLMGLSKSDLLYENVVLGLIHMLKGIIIKRDPSWFIFPLFLFIRGFGFGYNYIKSR